MRNIVVNTQQKLYYIPRPNRWTNGVAPLLPEAYKKFWKEWKCTKPEPVHYIPKTQKYYRDEQTGEVKIHSDVPIHLKYPKEINYGLWGGEAVVQGFEKRSMDKRRVAKFWVPRLKKSVVYSEILDKYIKVDLTYRTLDLIHKNYGLDHYILKTKACDLQGLLALRLKKQMLLALFDKNFYQNDPEKQEEVYNKYKDYLTEYKREDLEWYGLTFKEAVMKYIAQDRKEARESIVPLKQLYRIKLIEELKIEKREREEDEAQSQSEERKKTWIARLNPFSSQKSA